MCESTAAPSTGPGPEPPGLSRVSTQYRQARGAPPRSADAPRQSQDPAGNDAHSVLRTAAPSRLPGGAFEVSTLRVDATHSSMGVSGELDLAVAGILAAALARQLAAGYRHLRLDLSGVTFCGCSGLNVILAAHHQFAAAGGILTLTGLDAHLIRLLHLTGLHDVLFHTVNDHPTATGDAADPAAPDEHILPRGGHLSAPVLHARLPLIVASGTEREGTVGLVRRGSVHLHAGVEDLTGVIVGGMTALVASADLQPARRVPAAGRRLAARSASQGRVGVLSPLLGDSEPGGSEEVAALVRGVAEQAALLDRLRQQLASRSVVDQAVGITMALLRVDDVEALALLGASAQATARALSEVAADLVATLNHPVAGREKICLPRPADPCRRVDPSAVPAAAADFTSGLPLSGLRVRSGVCAPAGRV